MRSPTHAAAECSSVQCACMTPTFHASPVTFLTEAQNQECTHMCPNPNPSWPCILPAGKVYPMEEARAAAEESIREGRGGKVYIASE